jgi:peptidoglycan/xylan/chitin deacetylase (PgdA/CDA1 family)
MAGTISHVAPSQRRAFTPLIAVALLLVGAALTAVAWGFEAPVRVTVDGVEHAGLSYRTTVADLARAKFTRGRPGSLYTIHGGILRVNGGNPATFESNGRLVDDSQRVYDGDVVTSANGADVTEHIVSTQVSIDPTATIQGSGPILKVVRQGKPGLLLVRKGQISGEIDSSKVLVSAENIVLAASTPSSADKLVALTFDDGPWPGTTTATVEVLKQAGVPGTFFEFGEQVKRAPQLSKAVAADGNLVGNHGWSHAYLTRLKPAAVHKQITDSAAAIKVATGVAPTLLRPPYGAINHTVWVQAKAARESIVLWNVDARDWTRPGVDKIVSNVTDHLGRDSIVLLHDGGGPREQTLEALPKIIEWLKARNYTFVTVAQMEAVR